MSSESSGFWDEIVPRVDAEMCRHCADCPPVAACLARSFNRADPEGVPAIDDRLCFGCYSCAGACPHKAVILPRTR